MGLPGLSTPFNFRDVKRTLTPCEWPDNPLEQERTYLIAFASPRALMETRLIQAMDKVRRPERRSHPGGEVRYCKPGA